MPNDPSQLVLIAGGGPTGVTAALELRRFGIPVRIIDEKEGPASASRAVGIQARTLEEMELRGLADEFVRIGHHATGGDIHGDGKLLVHVDFTRIASPYNYLLFLSQSETDRILREALEDEGAAVEWGVKMSAFGQDPSGITATLQHTDGSFEQVRPAYVIDAEGAHSIIRSTLGLPFKGTTRDETFLLADVHVAGNLPNADFHIFSSEEGFLALFPMGGSLFRLVASSRTVNHESAHRTDENVGAEKPAAAQPPAASFDPPSGSASPSDLPPVEIYSEADSEPVTPTPLPPFPVSIPPTVPVESLPAEGPSEAAAPADAPPSDPPTLEELQAIYDRRAHIPARLSQLTWSSLFKINSRMVKTLRVGRIFLAGDAAHIHSPAGAQGMNTGIQDAMNLGWKLALVLEGKASETLLDTYQQDRLPVMRSILNRTESLTDAIEGSSILRSFFVHLAPWIAHGEYVQDFVTARISQIALNYRTSPLSDDHFGDGSLSAGDRVPDVSVRALQGSSHSETKRLFAMLNPSRFTLLIANSADPASIGAQLFNSLSHWRDLIEIAHIAAPEGDVQKAFAECFGTRPSITLVRPDAYVGFRGGEGSAADLVKYCNQWLLPAAQKQAA